MERFYDFMKIVWAVTMIAGIAIFAILMLTGCDAMEQEVKNVTYVFNADVIEAIDFDIEPAAQEAWVEYGELARADCELSNGGRHAHCVVNVPAALVGNVVYFAR